MHAPCQARQCFKGPNLTHLGVASVARRCGRTLIGMCCDIPDLPGTCMCGKEIAVLSDAEVWGWNAEPEPASSLVPASGLRGMPRLPPRKKGKVLLRQQLALQLQMPYSMESVLRTVMLDVRVACRCSPGTHPSSAAAGNKAHDSMHGLQTSWSCSRLPSCDSN